MTSRRFLQAYQVDQYLLGLDLGCEDVRGQVSYCEAVNWELALSVLWEMCETHEAPSPIWEDLGWRDALNVLVLVLKRIWNLGIYRRHKNLPEKSGW